MAGFGSRFLELYVDDWLAAAFVSRQECDPNRIGFYAEMVSGDFLQPRV